MGLVMPIYSWTFFKAVEKITQLASADGFNVEFVHLCGLDNFELKTHFHQ